jgi:hypothetical protein
MANGSLPNNRSLSFVRNLRKFLVDFVRSFYSQTLAQMRTYIIVVTFEVIYTCHQT